MSDAFNISLRCVATYEEADEIVALLAKHDILSEITKDTGEYLGEAIMGESPSYKFEVHVKESDQQLAESVLTESVRENITETNADYYLYGFTDDELIAVLVEKNEWSEFDVLLSEQILKDRGVSIDAEELEQRRFKRDLELEQPQGGQMGWIVAGYIFAFLGGFLGLILGYSLWQAKKRLPNGKRTPVYDETVRTHGRTIFFISLVLFSVFWIIRIATNVLNF